MQPDPIIDEIHRLRQQNAARHNFDLHEIFLDLKAYEQQSGKPVVARRSQDRMEQSPDQGGQ